MSESPVVEMCSNIILFGTAAGLGMAGLTLPPILVSLTWDVMRVYFEDWRDQRRSRARIGGNDGENKEENGPGKIE